MKCPLPAPGVLCALALALVVAGIPRPGLAGDVVQFVCDAMIPFSYEEQGGVMGEAVEAVRQVCARAGCDPFFVMAPWPWVLESMRHGQGDAVFTAIKTRDREHYLHYCQEPLGMMRFMLVGCDVGSPAVASLADLNGTLVGVIKGHATSEEFATSAWFARDESPNAMTMLRKCLAGRLDYIVINDNSLAFLSGMIPEAANLPVQPYLVHESPYFIAFSKVHADRATRWTARMDLAIRELRREGSLPPVPPAPTVPAHP